MTSYDKFTHNETALQIERGTVKCKVLKEIVTALRNRYDFIFILSYLIS